MIKLIQGFLLISGLLGTIITSAQNLEFYREDIVFILNENFAETDAAYHFCNVGNSDIKTVLFYPFPDNTLELINSIKIEDMITNAIIPYRKADTGIYFLIYVKAYGQSAYRVYFRQNLMDGHYKYILTTTYAWRRPLDIGNYELRMPLALALDSLSYSPDSTYVSQEIQYFIWKKKDFMPDKDFVVFFHSGQ